MRMKPYSGYLELDVNLNTEHNFNKYQGLKWGDAVRSVQDSQQEGAAERTYGMAGGLQRVYRREGESSRKEDEADRELRLQNDISTFYDSQRNGKVMHTQTLGGQITRHDSAEEAGKPMYFVGAFKGCELHLSQVKGTVQMRPQYHHLDAEDLLRRGGGGGGGGPQQQPFGAGAPFGSVGASEGPEAGPSNQREERPRALHQSYKPTLLSNPKGELEEQSNNMRAALQTAAEEPWTRLNYVDEDDEQAYEAWNERMFVKDTAPTGPGGGCPPLKSTWDGEEYLDALSATSTGRRRKRGGKRKEGEERDDEVG